MRIEVKENAGAAVEKPRRNKIHLLAFCAAIDHLKAPQAFVLGALRRAMPTACVCLHWGYHGGGFR